MLPVPTGQSSEKITRVPVNPGPAEPSDLAIGCEPENFAHARSFRAWGHGSFFAKWTNGLRVLGASLIYYSIELGILGLEGFRELRISHDPTSVSCSSTLNVEPSTLAAIKRTFSPWRGLNL